MVLAIVVAAFGLLYAVHLASYLSRISIQRVDVTGAKDIDPSLIESYIFSKLDNGSYQFISRKNIFFYPQAEIEREVLAYFPRLESISVSLSEAFSNTLRIEVKERGEYALWCSHQCYSMDSEGFVFALQSGTSTAGIFRGGIEGDPIGKRFIPGKLPSALALLKALSQAGFSAKELAVVGEDMIITLTRGFMLKTTFGQSPMNIVQNLRLLLSSEELRGRESQVEYIDLRFGDRVYFKLKGGEQNQ